MLTKAFAPELRARPTLARLPVEPIADDFAYNRVIGVLDRLFLLRRAKSCEELEYFHALAQIAYEYECNNA